MGPTERVLLAGIGADRAAGAGAGRGGFHADPRVGDGYAFNRCLRHHRGHEMLVINATIGREHDVDVSELSLSGWGWSSAAGTSTARCKKSKKQDGDQ